MVLMFLLVVLTSSVCGMTVTFYQAEEDDNVTIRWDIHTKTDMSLTNMLCFMWSSPLKLVYEMVKGVEVPESQDQQFAGRIQCDKDALRDGRIRLHVSRLGTEDSGNYWCDLAADNDKMMTTEHFVLNVTSRGENIITPGSTEDAEHTPGGPKKEVTSDSVILIVAVIVTLTAAVTCMPAVICQCIKDQHQARCANIELMTEIDRVHRLSDLHPQLDVTTCEDPNTMLS